MFGSSGPFAARISSRIVDRVTLVDLLRQNACAFAVALTGRVGGLGPATFLTFINIGKSSTRIIIFTHLGRVARGRHCGGGWRCSKVEE